MREPGLHPSADVAAAGWLGVAVAPLPAASAPAGPAPWNGEHPPEGNLPAELLGILCATLAEHTGTPGSCWFCLWDGYGWVHGSPSVVSMGDRGPVPVPPAFPGSTPERSRLITPNG